MSHTLKGTQEWLVGAIMARDHDSPDVETHVLPSAKQSAKERLHVYRHAYTGRLVECLEDDYPAIVYALGHERAEELFREYIAVHPSQSFSLNIFGQKMESFLRTKGEPFAAELAALEWSIVEAIHAADAAKMAPDALASVDPSEWGNVALEASPSLRLHAFAYPVNAYFQAYLNGEDPALPAPEPSWVAVYRVDMKVWRLTLTQGMFALLSPLARGASLEEAFETDVGDDADVGAWFRQWTTEGIFAGVTRKT